MKLCQIGIHLHVVQGTGVMGDGLFCLDCGRDRYPEHFGGFIPTYRKATKEDWRKIDAKRIEVQTVEEQRTERHHAKS